MVNCYGLHALHEFLHVPFLAHKRAVLETSMRLNTEAMGKVQKQLVTAKQNTFEDFVAAFEASGGRGQREKAPVPLAWLGFLSPWCEPCCVGAAPDLTVSSRLTTTGGEEGGAGPARRHPAGGAPETGRGGGAAGGAGQRRGDPWRERCALDG